jgi:hypothetical protein
MTFGGPQGHDHFPWKGRPLRSLVPATTCQLACPGVPWERSVVERSAVSFPRFLTDPNRAKVQQGRDLFNLRGGVSYPDGAVMCRTM